MRPSTAESTRPLSVAIREDSAHEHEAAEHSVFVTELLSGRVDEQGYAEYLLRLRVIYGALEDAVRAHRTDPLVAAVFDPALERVPAIDADLAHWAPGRDLSVDSPAAQRYRDRIAELSWGGALVAHHYTRYLGDLSGGQAMAAILDREFGLGGAGLTFYDFGFRVKPYRDAYRDRLDRLGLDATGVDRVVSEVKCAFALNQAVFDELARLLPGHRR